MIAETITDKNSNLLDRHTYKAAYKTVRAIQHPLRLEILRLIEEQGGIERVSEIYENPRFNTNGKQMEQSIASQHLAILRKAGLVKSEQDGKCRRYTVIEENLARITALCDELSEYQEE